MRATATLGMGPCGQLGPNEDSNTSNLGWRSRCYDFSVQHSLLSLSVFSIF